MKTSEKEIATGQWDASKKQEANSINKEERLLQDFLSCGGDKSLLKLLWFLIKKNKFMGLSFLMVNIRAINVLILPKVYKGLINMYFCSVSYPMEK